tara:strand:- start:119 stop:496 length:378 start_codon:yes stop_codon:yes gene_type:complete
MSLTFHEQMTYDASKAEEEEELDSNGNSNSDYKKAEKECPIGYIVVWNRWEKGFKYRKLDKDGYMEQLEASHPSGKFKIKKEDKCFCDDCYNYGVVEWKAMECFVCRDCAKTIIRNTKKFTKQWD